MAKEIYVGVDGTAQTVKALYVGVDGVAHKVKKVYVGVDGKARLAWSAGGGDAPALPESFTAQLTAEIASRYGILYRTREVKFTLNRDLGGYELRIGSDDPWYIDFPEQSYVQGFYLNGCPSMVLEAALRATSNSFAWGTLDWIVDADKIVCPNLPTNGFVLEYFSMVIYVTL